MGIMRQIDVLYQFVCKKVAVYANNTQIAAKPCMGVNSNARLKKLNYNKNIACFSKMRYHKRERIVYVGEKGIPCSIGNGKYGG